MLVRAGVRVIDVVVIEEGVEASGSQVRSDVCDDMQ